LFELIDHQSPGALPFSKGTLRLSEEELASPRGPDQLRRLNCSKLASRGFL